MLYQVPDYGTSERPAKNLQVNITIAFWAVCSHCTSNGTTAICRRLKLAQAEQSKANSNQ